MIDSLKKYIVLSWKPEIHKAFTDANKKALYLIDKSLYHTDNSFSYFCTKLDSLNIDYLVVSDLNHVGSIFSLVSLFLERIEEYCDVISCDERTQYAASIISRYVFNQESKSLALLKTKDKRLMKNSFNTLVRMARHFSLSTYIQHGEISSLPPGWAFPLVFKPTNLAGSIETYLINDLTTLNEKIKINIDNIS